ncbi:hypothetical protein Ancab_016189 [Ancistrocladus abbreviatus]
MVKSFRNQDLAKKVKEAGIRNCLTRPIGGNLILLTATGVKSIEEIVSTNRSFFEEWFETIDPWSKYDKGNGRFARIRASRIPLQIWEMVKIQVDEDVFLIQAVEEASNPARWLEKTQLRDEGPSMNAFSSSLSIYFNFVLKTMEVIAAYKKKSQLQTPSSEKEEIGIEKVGEEADVIRQIFAMEQRDAAEFARFKKKPQEGFDKKGQDESISLSKDELFGHIWMQELPTKVKIFAWHLVWSQLPTQDNLIQRGISYGDQGISYALYDEEEEDVHHLLVTCRVSQKVWDLFFQWWRVSSVLPNAVTDMLRQIVFGHVRFFTMPKSHLFAGWRCIPNLRMRASIDGWLILLISRYVTVWMDVIGTGLSLPCHDIAVEFPFMPGKGASFSLLLSGLHWTDEMKKNPFDVEYKVSAESKVGF